MATHSSPTGLNSSPSSCPSANDLKTFLSTKQAFTIDPTLGTLLAGPNPSPAEIESLMHDPTFPPTVDPRFATFGPEYRRNQMSAWADGLPGARRMAREMEGQKQKKRETEGDKRRSAEGLVHGGRFKLGSDIGDFTPEQGSTTFLSTKQAFTIDPTLGTLLAGPRPTHAEIESLMHDPTFPPTSNQSFATISREERRKQMSAWADGLPGARSMAMEMEKQKQKEREREEDEGDVNVGGLFRGGRFNFGYDMGEFTLANESEIPENYSATDSNSDESSPPTTNPTKDTISSSNNNFYNVPPYQRRYRLQGRPLSYNDDASSEKKQQAMTKLWLKQNPTLVFRLPSPEAEEQADDDDDKTHAENPIQVRCVAPLKEGDAHATAANPTRVWRVPSPSNDDGDDAHAPPAANPARLWRVPSPSDDDDDDDDDDSNVNNDNEAPLPTASAAPKGKRHAPHKLPRVAREMRMGRYIVTSLDAERVNRTGVGGKRKRRRRAKKTSVEAPQGFLLDMQKKGRIYGNRN
ncbi:hypothetical protein MMC31_006374 [Peltigera leucophlebia]|nr:hypothetical protein [Peltigera leucophlebia]